MYSPHPQTQSSFSAARHCGTGSADVLQVCPADLDGPTYDSSVEECGCLPDNISQSPRDQSDWLLHSGLWHVLYGGAIVLLLAGALFRGFIQMLNPFFPRGRR